MRYVNAPACSPFTSTHSASDSGSVSAARTSSTLASASSVMVSIGVAALDGHARHDRPVPRVLLLLPTSTYRATDFVEAAARLGVEVVVGSEARPGAWPTTWATGRWSSRCPTRRRGRGDRRAPRACADRRRGRGRRPGRGGRRRSRPSDSGSPTTPPRPSPPRGTRRSCASVLGSAAGAPAPVPGGRATSIGRSRERRRRSASPCVAEAGRALGEPRRDPRRRPGGSDRRRRRVSARWSTGRCSSRSTCPGVEVAVEGLLARRATARGARGVRQARPARRARTSRRRSTSRRRASRTRSSARGRRTSPARAARAIGLTDGPVHAELRIDGDADVGGRGRGAVDRRPVRAHAALRRRHRARGADPAPRARRCRSTTSNASTTRRA